MSDDEPDGLAYGDMQRAFLQAMLSRQTLTFEEAKRVIAAIQSAQTPERQTQPEDITIEEFEDWISQISDAIQPFDYEIRSSRHQQTKERIWALVNVASDAMTQMATVHSPDEIAFVKRVLDAIFDTNNTLQKELFAVPGRQALRLAKAPNQANRRETTDTQMQTEIQNTQAAGLTMAQAEKVLQNLVTEGWFAHSRRGNYSLSQRGIMELRNWLDATYNDSPDEDEDEDEDTEPRRIRIKTCAACAEIVTIGQRCPNLVCNTRLHDHCAGNYFRAQRGGQICSLCRTEWQDAPPVGEKADCAARGSAIGRRSSAVVDGNGGESDASSGANG